MDHLSVIFPVKPPFSSSQPCLMTPEGKSCFMKIQPSKVHLCGYNPSKQSMTVSGTDEDWRYCHQISLAYLFGCNGTSYPHKIWPHMVQCLHFRILEFPLKNPYSVLGSASLFWITSRGKKMASCDGRNSLT